MTPQTATDMLLNICRMGPVMPVLVLEDAKHVPALAQAMMAGRIRCFEVTLRTPAALDCIRAFADIPEAVVGAGTVITAHDADAAKAAGAQFAVAPGATESLLAHCEAIDLPILAGATTASEAMRLMDRGYGIAKFFPAEAAGGAAFLKALSGPLPHMRFCPTGGISKTNAAQYLALPNVVCVGGSWIAPRDAVRAGDHTRLQNLAQEASALRA